MAVLIRPVSFDDVPGILAIYGPYCESSHVSFEIVAPSEEQVRQRIAEVAEQFPWLVAEIDGQIAGYVYACRHRERAAYRWAVDVAVYIAASHHRRGIGRALYTCLFTLLREQGYIQAYAGVTLPNAGSVGLHEALGFRPVAIYPKVGYKLGRWRDVGWWQLQLQPAIDDPPEPQPFTAICSSDAVSAALAEGARLIALTTF